MRTFGVNWRKFAVFVALALSTPIDLAHASTFETLYSFMDAGDGGEPTGASLILDSTGNLYGTTAVPAGLVYELSPGWTETVLHYFSEGSGGFDPEGLVMDKKGNLWGTTSSGGNGGGVIFEITTRDKEKLIHTFEGPPNDGCGAWGTMVADSRGNLFGTTSNCGKYGYGTVFELGPERHE